MFTTPLRIIFVKTSHTLQLDFYIFSFNPCAYVNATKCTEMNGHVVQKLEASVVIVLWTFNCLSVTLSTLDIRYFNPTHLASG